METKTQLDDSLEASAGNHPSFKGVGMLPLIRIRYEKQGGHYHCRLFTAPEPDRTFAKCGDLVFDEREWPLIKAKLAQSVEFIDD